ncbi:MAG TPA: Fe-S protein assembly co-chaperone HscB [Terriglobales bacterium]|nr:Fe-S protein assembly co-chaperone HscB [Terriglobales bacterium]
MATESKIRDAAESGSESSAQDFFGIFGLPRRLNIDLKALEREFYRLSRKLHPDLYARASAEEQAWSLEQSSRLNDAYRTLRDPIARTEYLLKLEGVQLEEQSRAATDQARESGTQKKQVVPADLLEEVFDLNMQLEEMRAAKKMGEQADASVQRDLETARINFTARLEAISAQLQTLWSEWDAAAARCGSGAERNHVRDKIVDLLNRRSYIRNLVRDVNEALEA